MDTEVLRIALFGLLQALATTYAVGRGGWPERAAGVGMLAALLAGWLLPFDASLAYRHVELARFAIDLLLGIALVTVALWADRYWPLWIASLQMLALGVHGVRGYDSDLLPIAYNRLVEWAAYPMLALLVAGTFRFHRRRAEDERRDTSSA